MVEEDAADIEVVGHTSSFGEECKTTPGSDGRRKVVDNCCPTGNSEVGGDSGAEKQRKADHFACLSVLLWSNRDLRAYLRTEKLAEILPDLSGYLEIQKRPERSSPTNECSGKALDLRPLRTRLPKTETSLYSRLGENLLVWLRGTELS